MPPQLQGLSDVQRRAGGPAEDKRGGGQVFGFRREAPAEVEAMAPLPQGDVAHQPAGGFPSDDPAPVKDGMGEALVSVVGSGEEIYRPAGAPVLDGQARVVRPGEGTGWFGLAEPVDFQGAVGGRTAQT